MAVNERVEKIFDCTVEYVSLNRLFAMMLDIRQHGVTGKVRQSRLRRLGGNCSKIKIETSIDM
ncbi:hypothetical protein HK096_006216, partial [Nowakowskiella sp. JEL0078]